VLPVAALLALFLAALAAGWLSTAGGLRGAFTGVAGGLGARRPWGLAVCGGVAVYVMCGLGRGFLSAPRLLEAVRGGCSPGLLYWGSSG
jgi:hypothetical protein